MKRKILIADDEPHIARILTMSLERAGYQVTCVPNGLRALESIRASAPDLFITDIEMPIMDGRELLDRLQQELPEREFNILVMTSRTNLEYRQWSKTYDKLDFFEKPVSARRLLDRLNDLFEIVEPS